MGRKAEGFVETALSLAAKLPAWLDILVAVITAVVFHLLATQSIATPVPKGAWFWATPWFKTLSTVLQVVLPLLFVFCATATLIQQKRREALFNRIMQSQSTTSVLSEMTWQQFQMALKELFKLQGFTAVEKVAGAGDERTYMARGKQDEKIIVQCKQWQAMQVSLSAIRELHGLMSVSKVGAGYVVTAGRFTQEARSYARGRNIVLVDGQSLEPLMQKAEISNHRQAAQVDTQKVVLAKLPGAATKAPAAAVACPRCGSAMVKRVAERGTKAGQEFWGCVKYPSCDGMRPVH
jgi:restriction system protein